MRIIFYSPHPTHDIVSEVGYATHQREIINALKGAGHDVFPIIMGGTEIANINPIATQNYKTPFYKKFIKLVLPRFIWTSLNNHKLILHDKKAGLELEKAIIKIKPDLIYERSEYLQDSGAKMSIKHKIKYFTEVNAPFVEEMKAFEGYSLYHNRAEKVEKFKYDHAEKIFCVSSDLAKFLVEKYACDKNKIIVQANCINPDKIKTDPDLMMEFRNKLELENKKVIGFVGSMFPYHGVDKLIKAYSNVKKVFPDTVLLIVGDGIVMQDLKKLVSVSDIKDVKFTGSISHSLVFNYIELMNICVMANSNWYGSPVKIFEYGLMKKSIIAPDLGPVKDVMINDQDGLLVSDDINSLEKAILSMINRPEEAQKMAENFHKKVLENYTWKKAAEHIIEQCI